MDALLNGLLSISRLGRMDFNYQKINTTELFEEILSTFEYQFKSEKFEVKLNVLEPCKGDPVQLNQLFSNLISNSLKYRDPNKKGELTISNYIENGSIVFLIKDNGIGIKKEHQNKVFEFFHRLNPKDSAGEGLGLAIVKKILTKHSGKIWIESKENIGSKFYVSLPI